MAVAAVSSDPISFFTTQGTELSIPITALSFDDQGHFVVDPAYAVATAWLTHLVDIGVIRQGTTPPVAAAIVFTAVDIGSFGNEIQIDISYPPGVTDKFDIEVSATSAYKGLTKDTVAGRVGNQTKPGTEPGVVVLDPTATPNAPGDGTFSGTLTQAASSLKVTIAAADVLTLVPAKSLTGTQKIDVTVTAKAGSFDLTAIWQDSKSGIDASGALAALGQFSTMVKASTPTGSAPPLPQAGTYTLGGGVDARAAAVTTTAKPG